MDILTFVSNMTAALAWPLIVGGIAYAYKDEIKHLVSGMRRLKLGPVEAEMFERDARAAKQLAAALATEPAERKKPTSIPSVGVKGDRAPPTSSAGIEGALLELLESPTGSYRFSVVRIWSVLEDALRSLAEKNGANPGVPVVTMLLDLERRKLLTGEELALLRKLFDLRNEALHGFQVVSEDGAMDYVLAASAVLSRIGMSDRPGRSDILRESPLGVVLEERT